MSGHTSAGEHDAADASAPTGSLPPLAHAAPAAGASSTTAPLLRSSKCKHGDIERRQGGRDKRRSTDMGRTACLLPAASSPSTAPPLWSPPLRPPLPLRRIPWPPSRCGSNTTLATTARRSALPCLFFQPCKGHRHTAHPSPPSPSRSSTRRSRRALCPERTSCRRYHTRSSTRL